MAERNVLLKNVKHPFLVVCLYMRILNLSDFLSCHLENCSSRGFFISFFYWVMLRKGHGGHTKPQQRKKEESEQLRGARDKIKFIDRRFERWQVVGLRKARRRQNVP